MRRRAPGPGHEAISVPRDILDIGDSAALRHHLEAARPDAVIHCAAYTAVDAAETDRDAAFATNADGAGNMARACAALGLPLVHVSTDYVFDGASKRPYREDDPIAPIGVYGASKAAGESAVRAEHPAVIVVRTSWVFSRDGASFVRTIARAAIERATLRVVDDQLGCPTFAEDLADVLIALAERATRRDEVAATYHACNDGAVTWCGFARAIVGEARKHREIACTDVTAISTADYPTAARRPAYSVLDTSRVRALGIPLPSWTHGLAKSVAALVRTAPPLEVEDRT